MDQSPPTNIHERAPKIEVERKYLLAREADAVRLEEKIAQLFTNSRLFGAWSETSYYFPQITKEKARQLLTLVMRSRPEEGTDLLEKFDKIPEGTPIQMRLRLRKNPNLNGEFVLTFKAGANPLHDIERIEIETSDISRNYIEGFAANGVEPSSIWHSNRRVYTVDENTKIDVQNVTGYGWTAEIESNNLGQINQIADKLGLQPLTKASLDAMYVQYGKNWQKYYTGEGQNRHFSESDWSEIKASSKESVIRNQIS